MHWITHIRNIVSNLIRGKGVRAIDYGDHWPLYYCTESRNLTADRPNLIRLGLVDPTNGLLDAMLSSDCINHQQKHHVEIGAIDEDQNNVIYNLVYWGSLATYYAFIRCLLQTKQHQVVSLLAPSLVGDVRPLSDNHQARLKRNYFTLVDIMNSKDGLTAELYAADCITGRQKEYIESATTQSKRNERLTDIVIRGSETNYHKFIEYLNNTGQRHVSRILMEDGAVACIVASISPSNNRVQK